MVSLQWLEPFDEDLWLSGVRSLFDCFQLLLRSVRFLDSEVDFFFFFFFFFNLPCLYLTKPENYEFGKRSQLLNKFNYFIFY